MKRSFVVAALVGLAMSTLPDASAEVPADRVYRVTIRNLTSGQPLSPVTVATHRKGLRIFQVGAPASFAIKEIAENGNNAPLLTKLENSMAVFDVFGDDEPLVPDGTPGAAMFDDSVTFTIESAPTFRRLSFATMLVCTNDGFTGLGGQLRLPGRVGGTVIRNTAAYDAGTEINTEDFADLVPPCQDLIGVSSGEPGTGMSDPALAEGGVIHHHQGIQGIADLVPEVHGWTDPVARIRVKRIA
jgi:hypothetical protein